MKATYLIWLALLIIGVLYVVHNYMSHGGVSGIRSGLGLGNGGNFPSGG